MSVIWIAAGILAIVPVVLVQQRQIAQLRRRRPQLAEGTESGFVAGQLIEVLPCPVFYKGADGRFLDCSSAFAEHFGLHRDQIVGRMVDDIAFREMGERCAVADAALFAGSGAQIYDLQVQTADGSPRNAIVHASTFEPADGTVGVVGVIVDIIGQNQADRKNPLKVCAYEHSGNWWYPSNTGRFYFSTDGGRTFTAISRTWAPNGFNVTDLAVNPFVEGDIWLADANNLWHSVDSGQTCAKLTAIAAVGTEFTYMHGAIKVALGAPAIGSTYSATVYPVGTINGTDGVYRSDDGASLGPASMTMRTAMAVWVESSPIPVSMTACFWRVGE